MTNININSIAIFLLLAIRVSSFEFTTNGDSTNEGNGNPSPLNFVVILVDDLGFGDLSLSGHPTSYTPNIDRLSETGKYFEQFYVTSPVCSPSR